MKKESSKASPGTVGGHDEKARRLAEALRENLRRRKAQSRARSGAVEAGTDETNKTPGGNGG